MKQANVQVQAPGFFGLNSEASPVGLNEQWASVADNVVLDGTGRLTARKGYRILTSDNSDLGSVKLQEIHEANYKDGTTVRFAVGNNKIFTFDTAGTLTDITPVAATITADFWQIVTLNDDTLFFQEDHEPIIYDKSTATCSLISAHADAVGTCPEADVAAAAYGRIWCGNTTTNKSTISWSDLLIPAAWSGGSSGSLDLTTLWPNGNDEITAIATHNNKLIIFGRRSILMFGSSAIDGKLGDPNTDILLEDDITDMGCISKYGVADIGNDLWYIDDSGVRSFGRSVQEEYLPIGNVTQNVRTILSNELRVETNKPRLLYDVDAAYVLLLLEGLPQAYCIDTRFPLQDGSYRITTWTGLDFSCVGRSVDGTIWYGNNDGINKKQGYIDGASSLGAGGTNYWLRYYMHPQQFGVPSNLKILKEADYVISGGVQQKAVAKWTYDYGWDFKSQVFYLDVGTVDFYDTPEDEYNNQGDPDPDDPTEYWGGNGIKRYDIPLSGSGTNVIVGLEIEIAGNKASLQEINVQTKIGRMV